MKKSLLFLLAAATTIAAFSQSSKSFYYEKISNPGKTINFTFGVYHGSMETVSKSDGNSYSKMMVAVINDKNADDLYWSDYKVYILLRSGELIYNYTTEASSGDFACKYHVPGGSTHKQYICFGKTFQASDIQKVWLCLADNNFINLFLNE